MKRETPKTILAYALIITPAIAACAGLAALLIKHPAFLKPAYIVAMAFFISVILWHNSRTSRCWQVEIVAIGLLLLTASQMVLLADRDSVAARVVTALAVLCSLVALIGYARRRRT